MVKIIILGVLVGGLFYTALIKENISMEIFCATGLIIYAMGLIKGELEDEIKKHFKTK